MYIKERSENMCNIDKLSILKTDTIPYEIPLIYSNDALSNFIRIDNNWSKIDKICWNTIYRTKPYWFKVYKSDNEDRDLSLCHPLGQLYILKFLELYDESIIDYFNLNEGFSLRRPEKINSKYLKEKEYVETQFKKIFKKDIDESSNEYYDYIDSYYIKKPFVKITDFYSSYMLNNLEAKYSYLRKLDISKCFYNIYTHSIEWAFLGSKEEAKLTINKGSKLGANLDKLMQYCNYAETNGIVVGPEFSRIVAEIILCRIDMNVAKRTKDEKYEVYRFMDDIFIFSNTINVLDIVEKIYKEELFSFKLSINNQKVCTYNSPFFDEQIWITDLKMNLNKYRETFKLREIDKSKEDWILIKKVKFNDRNIFETIRILLIKNRRQATYIVSYLMTYIDRNLENVINCIQDQKKEIKEYNIVRLIDFISYFVSFNLCCNNTIKLCKIYITLLYKFKNEFSNIEDFIYKKLFEIIKYNKRNFIDIQNIIVILTFIEKDLPEDIFISWLLEEKDYFALMVITFYVATKNRKYKYKKTKQIINDIVFNKAENYLEKDDSGIDIKDLLYDFDIILMNDFYNSSIISKETKGKIDIIKSRISGKTPKGEMDKCYFKFIKEFKNSFINWNANIEDITKVILIKSRYTSSNLY
ncbi:RNA-directed DNA polymerase [Clostridium sulfidigenes]|uniref:RNA-directed DNA polymerase n=1 Tax=Clostridium sulfidigenes TaxID=318464 RepID=UPI003F8AC0DB